MLGASKFIFVILVTAAMTAACDKSNSSYSLEGESTSFQQSTTYAPKPIDVLWVVDNSGSMQTSQTNLTANFQSFISRFQTKQYDFNMAVISTESWYGKYITYDNPDLRRFKDGVTLGHTNVFVMNKNTPNLNQVFLWNATLGIGGNGDERAFESMVDSLTWSGNSAFNFRRANAYLAVIIVSDEDDFSATTSNYLNENYNSSQLVPISTYVNWLDTYTGSTAATRNSRYSVNTISIQSTACLNQLQNSAQRIGIRYAQLANATQGLNLSLCGDFASNLNFISSSIEAAISEIKLDREPIVATIEVRVNSAILPQDPVNGWTYNSSTMILKFNGTGIPPANAVVTIYYDPAAPKQ